MIVIIVAGGCGSRLWPMSRVSDPKLFLKLSDGHSLLQNTFNRAYNLENVSEIITVTNEKILFRIQDEYMSVNQQQVQCSFLLEPYGKNTAPAVLLACLHLLKHHSSSETVLVLPADHLITEVDKFNSSIEDAIKIAQHDFIVTLGITPEYPETGYGYIQIDRTRQIANGYGVKSFNEKPPLEVAQQYVNSGEYYWNAGVFCAKLETFVNQFKIHAYKLYQAADFCINHAINSSEQIIRLESDYFDKLHDISIDHAICELSDKIAVLPCTIGWSDVGSWLSIAQALPVDSNNNAVVGESVLYDVKDCLIYSTNRVVAGLNIEGLIVVDAQDAVLIADKNNAQEVRKVFEHLRNISHKTSDLHLTAYRPWGTYTVLEDAPHYKIKRIDVKPHAALSLQMHRYRNEHWVVITGVATVVNGDTITVLHINQSTYIPANTKHRLINDTDDVLTVIEVQCGSYLGEDDIIRFEDKYGRHGS